MLANAKFPKHCMSHICSQINARTICIQCEQIGAFSIIRQRAFGMHYIPPTFLIAMFLLPFLSTLCIGQKWPLCESYLVYFNRTIPPPDLEIGHIGMRLIL